MQQHFLEATKEDLIKFSTKGFRTLCVAFRVLERKVYEEWMNRYEQAKLEQIRCGIVQDDRPDQVHEQTKVDIL